MNKKLKLMQMYWAVFTPDGYIPEGGNLYDSEDAAKDASRQGDLIVRLKPENVEKLGYLKVPFSH